MIASRATTQNTNLNFDCNIRSSTVTDGISDSSYDSATSIDNMTGQDRKTGYGTCPDPAMKRFGRKHNRPWRVEARQGVICNIFSVHSFLINVEDMSTVYTGLRSK